MAPEIKLTRAEVADMVAKRRAATLEELEWLFAHAKDQQIHLSDTEQFELRSIAARLQSDRRRGQTNREQSERFVTEVLGTYRTPYGDLNRSDVVQLEVIHAAAERAIATCRDHKPERCGCWREARDELFELRRNAGDKTPLGIAALAIWNAIESLARDRNIEPAPQLPSNLSPQAQADFAGSPVPNAYNWRYYKSPTYTEHVR